MDEPVENGISQGRVADSLMPVRYRQLTGDDSGIVAVFKYFQEIMSALVIEWLKPPVIDDEESGGQYEKHYNNKYKCRHPISAIFKYCLFFIYKSLIPYIVLNDIVPAHTF